MSVVQDLILEANQNSSINQYSIMTPTLLIITVFALIGIALIVLAFCAKRFSMSRNAFSNGILLGAVLFGLAITSTGCDIHKYPIDLRGSSSLKLVYEIDTGVEQDDLSSTGFLTSEDFEKLSSIIKDRLKAYGIIRVIIRQQSDNKVEINLRNINREKVEQIKDIITRHGSLEFHILADRRYPGMDEYNLIKLAEKTDDQIIKNSTENVIGMWVPVMEGRESEFNEVVITRTRTIDNKETLEVLCKKDIYDVTGRYLTSAKASVDEKGQNCINFYFDKEGADLFGKLTSMNLPNRERDLYRRLGIILDGALHSAPQINGRISSNGVITGNFTKESAQELATVLNSGSLPVKFKKEPVLEELH